MASITADRIRATPGAMRHIASVFVRHLYDLNVDAGHFNAELENNILREIRNAVPRGIVLYSYPSEDTHNPLDRQLEIYTYVEMHNIDRELEGVAKLKVLCRLSVHNATLTLRSINRDFEVE